jgi:hypothetical protein
VDLWKQARNHVLRQQVPGQGPNSLIQHITELKKSEKGARAVITLLADLTGDGVAGDRTLEGNEEAMQTFDQVIRIDQLRHANRHEGKMADQKSVVEFRGNSRDVLAYWLADRIDQMAFLTLAGMSLHASRTPAARPVWAPTCRTWSSPPTSPRRRQAPLRWDNATRLMDSTTGSNTSSAGGAVAPADTPMLGAVRPAEGLRQGKLHPRRQGRGRRRDLPRLPDPAGHGQAEARQRLHAEPAPRAAAWQGQRRSSRLECQDRRHLPARVPPCAEHPHRRCSARSGATGRPSTAARSCSAAPRRWAWPTSATPEWVEKGFDYDNQQGISVGKIAGLPEAEVRHDLRANSVEDFGVISCYVAQ